MRCQTIGSRQAESLAGCFAREGVRQVSCSVRYETAVSRLRLLIEECWALLDNDWKLGAFPPEGASSILSSIRACFVMWGLDHDQRMTFPMHFRSHDGNTADPTFVPRKISPAKASNAHAREIRKGVPLRLEKTLRKRVFLALVAKPRSRLVLARKVPDALSLGMDGQVSPDRVHFLDGPDDP